MASAIGPTPQQEVGPPFEQAVQDGLGQVSIMKQLAEGGQRFVRGHDHGPCLEVAVVDHPVQHVGGIGSIALVAEFVDDEDVGMDERFESFLEASLGGCGREVADELVGGGEPVWVAKTPSGAKLLAFPRFGEGYADGGMATYRGVELRVCAEESTGSGARERRASPTVDGAPSATRPRAAQG